MEVKKIKVFISRFFTTMLIVAIALFCSGCSDKKDDHHIDSSLKQDVIKLGEGEKQFLFEVVSDSKEVTYYEISTDKEIVENRGHNLGDLEQVPIIVEDEIESVKTTKQTREIFEKLGVYDDIIRAKEGKRIRAGRGKTRGRKYKKVKGPLVVVGEDKGISLGARNHAGVDVVVVENLNAELLAPGTHAGRLTVYTKSAVEKLGGLFQ